MIKISNEMMKLEIEDDLTGSETLVGLSQVVSVVFDIIDGVCGNEEADRKTRLTSLLRAWVEILELDLGLRELEEK